MLFISQMCGREWELWSPRGGALLGSGAGEVLAKGTVIASVQIQPLAHRGLLESRKGTELCRLIKAVPLLSAFGAQQSWSFQS